VKRRPSMISLVRVLVVAVAAAGTFSCSSPGYMTYRDADREIEVRQPTDPDGAATVTILPDGGVVLSTPETHTPASYTEKATVNWLMVFGGLFAAAAVLAAILRAKVPVIPSNAPVGLGIASAICFALPTVIDKYLLYILIGAAIWAVWIWYSYRHNVRLERQQPTSARGAEKADDNDDEQESHSRPRAM
jgi:hypothetical protein